MFIIVYLLSSFLSAQGIVDPKVLTRGQLWFSGNPNGSFERVAGLGTSSWELIYPGYWGAHRNAANGGYDKTLVYNHGIVGGEKIGWYYRSGNYDDEDVYAVEQSQLHQNYNFENSFTEPEEYITGKIGSFKLKNNIRHMGYELEGKIMVWSIPKYDDFIIIKCKLTNTDDLPITDYYYSHFFIMDGPLAPSGITSGWDVEYLWEPDISPEIGFVFYDNTSLPPTTNPPVYTIPPGDSTGNAGDPGNIATQGSTDYRLYSPYVYAYSFIASSVTPNKNGEKKVWRNILSTSGNAPIEELWPGTFEQMRDYQTAVNLITQYNQPQVNWKDANATYVSGNKAGSLWERNPLYIYSIGPYDLQPGESIEWIEVLLCGQMDRNITMKGGLNATTRFVQEGLVNLKENWKAVQELIANNFVVPAGNIPPPTPADAPRVGNSNELTVAAATNESNGVVETGVNITWKAVHENYVDPATGVADFAGYRIYRSDVSIEGPWALVDSVLISDVGQFTQNGSVTKFVKSLTGVPYRYCVTSFDTEGNESAKTGYSFFTVSAEFQPNDLLSGVRVVPNPFRQTSGFADPSEAKRLAFVNIPGKCTIKIYTVALDLVKTIEHDNPQSGLTTWGSARYDDYMLTDFALNVSPGVYIYHIESKVEGHVGESTVGKIVILK